MGTAARGRRRDGLVDAFQRLISAGHQWRDIVNYTPAQTRWWLEAIDRAEAAEAAALQLPPDAAKRR